MSIPCSQPINKSSYKIQVILVISVPHPPVPYNVLITSFFLLCIRYINWLFSGCHHRRHHPAIVPAVGVTSWFSQAPITIWHRARLGFSPAVASTATSKGSIIAVLQFFLDLKPLFVQAALIALLVCYMIIPPHAAT